MPAIDIREATPEHARIYEDGDLIGEIFRDESAIDDDPPFYVVHLTEDPRGPKRICVNENLFETVHWMVDSHPLW